ncbi:MAG: hypothetical protein AAFP97_13465, partial [Pseudomonadota bacterium]
MNHSVQFNTGSGIATLQDWSAPFGRGRAGTVPMIDGREGDAKTPLGDYSLRFGFYRGDRLPRAPSALTFHAIIGLEG